MSLSNATLLYAYAQGIFPMAHEDGIYWYDPDPRAVLPLDRFHIPRSLERTLRKRPFEVRFDSAFLEVIEACAAPASGRGSTWISPELVTAYTGLHQKGHAHSVECWQNERLVGGLYGVSINSFFAGESMFSLVSEASKVALVFLIRRLRERGFFLLDVQFNTEHLRRFGVVEIPRQEYRRRLGHAIRKANSFD